MRARSPRVAAGYRLLVVTLLGCASGLPLALTGQAMQAWLAMDGLDVATIGFLSLVGLPYTFKFLWAPLMDRFDIPWLGRRRGWLVLTQLVLGCVLFLIAAVSPSQSTRLFAMLALLIAFVSASQDVVIDAYRTNLLPAHERGLGASLSVFGYRLAMIVSGGIALIWTDPANAAAGAASWSWPEVYRLMGALMFAAALLSAFGLPKLSHVEVPRTVARNDVIGFVAVLAAVAAGVVFTDRLGGVIARTLLGPLLDATALDPALKTKWIDLGALLLGVLVTLPLAAWVARRARFETLLEGMRSYFAQSGAVAFLLFVVLYKLGDAFAGSLLTPFLLNEVGFSGAEVGVVNKIIGLWLTIAGALFGGALMLKLGLWRALLFFGVLQMVSNIGFWWLATYGAGTMGALTLPAFDIGIVSLAAPTRVDGGLVAAVAFENVSSGMGTAAFVAFLMALCNQRFTATQFALLSALAAVGRVWVAPLAGVLAETIGWPMFFVVSTIAALPGLLMLGWLRSSVDPLDAESASDNEPAASEPDHDLRAP